MTALPVDSRYTPVRTPLRLLPRSDPVRCTSRIEDRSRSRPGHGAQIADSEKQPSPLPSYPPAFLPPTIIAGGLDQQHQPVDLLAHVGRPRPHENFATRPTPSGASTALQDAQHLAQLWPQPQLVPVIHRQLDRNSMSVIFCPADRLHFDQPLTCRLRQLAYPISHRPIRQSVLLAIRLPGLSASPPRVYVPAPIVATLFLRSSLLQRTITDYSASRKLGFTGRLHFPRRRMLLRVAGPPSLIGHWSSLHTTYGLALLANQPTHLYTYHSGQIEVLWLHPDLCV